MLRQKATEAGKRGAADSPSVEMSIVFVPRNSFNDSSETDAKLSANRPAGLF